MHTVDYFVALAQIAKLLRTWEIITFSVNLFLSHSAELRGGGGGGGYMKEAKKYRFENVIKEQHKSANKKKLPSN